MNGNFAPGFRILRKVSEFDFAKNLNHGHGSEEFNTETGSELPVRSTSYQGIEKFCYALIILALTTSVLRGRGYPMR